MPLEDREAPEPESPLADGEQPGVAPLTCEACGAGMLAGQDWCLDCGTAAPGRLGARPGWRAAFTVVGATLLLLVGAGAAAYAALTGDAERDASKPSAGSGNPIIAQTPGLGQPLAPVTPGATGPGTTAPKPPGAPPPVATQSPSSPTSTPQPGTGSNTGTSAGTTNNSSSSNSGASGATTGPRPIKVAGASLYNPEKRAGAEFGPAANAVDASTSSVWDVTVPVDNDPLGVGLVINLGALYTLKSLTISTPTSGFDVELYATKGKKLPPDVLDRRWDHLTDRVNYTDGRTISLKGRADGKVRFINLWFAEAGDAKDPRVAIGDVKVFGTR